MGKVARVTNSKSCQLRMKVVAAIPAAANAKPISSAAGSAAMPQMECTRPMASMTTRKAAA